MVQKSSEIFEKVNNEIDRGQASNAHDQDFSVMPENVPKKNTHLALAGSIKKNYGDE